MSNLNSLSIGAWQGICHPAVTEAMLSTKIYDWLAVDLEHAGFDENILQTIFLICEKMGVTSFARLSSHDPYQGRKMLDLGAKGLIIPNIETAEQLNQLTAHFFYPPNGKRGVCLSRINQWGDSFEDYFKKFSPLIVPQIESRKAIDNIDFIVDLPYVKHLFLGPYDLSASLGIPGDFEHETFKQATERFLLAAKQKNKIAGIHVIQPNIDDLKIKKDQGYKFIAFATDVTTMRYSLNNSKDYIKEIKL